MADQLSADFIARIRARAKDPSARSDISAMAARSRGADELIEAVPKPHDPAVREYLAGMNTPFAGMISNLSTGDGSQAKGLLGLVGSLLGGKQVFGSMGDQTVSFSSKIEPAPAPPPCTEADVAAAEEALGFLNPAGCSGSSILRSRTAVSALATGFTASRKCSPNGGSSPAKRSGRGDRNGRPNYFPFTATGGMPHPLTETAAN